MMHQENVQQTDNVITTDLAVERSTPQAFARRDANGKIIGAYRVTTQSEKETMAYALGDFDHLINRNERPSPLGCADRITAGYDTSAPQNADVVRTL